MTTPKFTRQGYATTFRVVADDVQLGNVLGRYAAVTLQSRAIAVIDDRTAYGQGLAQEFEKDAVAAGGKVVSRQYTTDKATDFSAILTAFATVIAIGVVYNNARIALAERAWELASLRVLGFSRAEVSAFLLGELAIEIALALPLGALLGYGLASVIVQLIQTDEFFFPMVVQSATYAYAALSVLVAGAVSALIVRRRIDTLDLVGVLKTRE